MDTIRIRGARTHNLKNVDLDLPRDRLIVLTGISGSGKSSLAFDTIYAEGQRRYVESLSAYARQFLSMMEKPDVDHIEGLSPAISIEQRTTSHNPRSTVGTITEIYDYLRLLYARVGEPRCPEHGTALAAQTISQMVDQVLALPESERWMLLAPVIEGRKGEHQQILEELKTKGYLRARIDGRVVELENAPALNRAKKHTIEVVVDRFRVRPDLAQRLAESFENALELAGGRVRIAVMESTDGEGTLDASAPDASDGQGATEELIFSSRFACPICSYSLPELEPRLFSFNNPVGACSRCDGLGVDSFMDPERVVKDTELSLQGGAVGDWDPANVYYLDLMNSIAEHYGFDIYTPYKDLPESARHAILQGTGKEKIRFEYTPPNGEKRTRIHPFEGVIPNMERRYRETESIQVRERLARFLNMRPCPDCQGTRLNIHARHVFVADRTLPAVSALPVGAAGAFLGNLSLPGHRGEIAEKILKEINQRLNFLVNVGLEYLTLDRSAETLSGGEAQRIRLASQIGAGLVGVMYILDEPSIGLHQRDNQRLLNTLIHLRDMGNTVIVVEHDEEAIRAADHVVDIGPGAGVHGGRISAQGTPEEIETNPASLTGQYLSGARRIPVPESRHRKDPERVIQLTGARGNNLKSLDVEIPIGLMTCITGVSGSGKSTLINDTLYPLAARRLNRVNMEPAPHQAITGLSAFDKVVDIDQSPIGRTPRSNPATYTGFFTPIRELFAQTQEARSRGYTPGRFSFNVKSGRCPTCQGGGMIRVEMHFLPDIYVVCDTCAGQRYSRETLDIRYKGKTIHEVLEMTIEDALDFFAPVPTIARKLETLADVGLGYLKLGQSATTLSGGEAQRIKLSRELSKRATGNTLYILDEPTTGLHFHDIEQLLAVLHRLRDWGNTVVVIEHNLDIIKTADWVIDLGPEGGGGGGRIVATGTPEEIAEHPDSHTGRFLGAVLKNTWRGEASSQIMLRSSEPEPR
uniref:UvrABC system protein A n=1 Tax=Candidatus Kentrum sp. UNK TaxID=2126344 RepID=A0A451ALR4_9GAMM|nr:MAG: Excinuclease ABC subunit A [Candidatus Kentron sp. UNK]VFK72471.1 MAG: Excinuclease ABC subunit A [Candidatus Kentron sp. UNK]